MNRGAERPIPPAAPLRRLIVRALACATLVASGTAHALVYTEGLNDGIDGSRPTGSTFATAQFAASPLGGSGTIEAIQGRLTSSVPINGTPVFEVDLYRIEVIDGARFSAATRSANPFDDTELFLFDAGGHGLYANDDNPTDFLSTLSGRSLQNGFYYLGVSLGGFEALDASGRSIFDGGLPSAGTGVLASWATVYASVQELRFGYDVALTGVGFGAVAAIPEPGTVALLAIGLGAVWMRRRHSTRRC